MALRRPLMEIQWTGRGAHLDSLTTAFEAVMSAMVTQQRRFPTPGRRLRPSHFTRRAADAARSRRCRLRFHFRLFCWPRSGFLEPFLPFPVIVGSGGDVVT